MNYKKILPLLTAAVVGLAPLTGGMVYAQTTETQATEEPLSETQTQQETPTDQSEETVQETEKAPQVEIQISAPEGWQGEEAEITILAEDTAQSGIRFEKIEARAGKSGNWEDVTEEKTLTVTDNCTVYVRVTDSKGGSYEENRDIQCFDREKPTLAASMTDGVLSIQAKDQKSGIAKIYVNGNEYTELEDGALTIRLQENNRDLQKITIQAEDKAGNMSVVYSMINPYYGQDSGSKESGSGAIGTSQNNGTASGEGVGNSTSGSTASSSLPLNAQPSEPTSAKGTVTENTVTEDSDTEETGSSTQAEKNFYTITTKSGKIFYLIIDESKTSDNVYLLTEVGENDLLNFVEGTSQTLPSGTTVYAVPEDTSEIQKTREPEQEKETEQETEEKGQEETKEGGINYAIAVLAALGLGVGFYFKVWKPKHRKDDQTFEESEYEEDEYEEEPDEEPDEVEETEDE